MADNVTVVVTAPGQDTVTVTPTIASVTILPPATAAVHTETDTGTNVTIESNAAPPIVIQEGQQGPPGLQGPQGPPGRDGTSYSYFVYTQEPASTTWTIVHNLGRTPDISLYDTAGTRYPVFSSYASDPNTVILTFSRPLSGTAYLN